MNQLTRRFGTTVAVDAIDLRIEPGELFFLLGPSGCGKTTLLRLVAGLLPPDTGRIYFDDRDVTDLPTGRRNTALVFQSYALWPHLTVWQNVTFGLEVRKVSAAEKKQRAAQALQRVQMADLADRRPGQLSGGQQQRVALARALVVNPDVLLLDEPLSNLDAALRQDMRQQIRRICKAADITAIYVTHDQAEALSMADRIALMNDGRISQVGTPPDIYHRPANRFAAAFMGAANFIPAEVVGPDDRLLRLRTAAGPLLAATWPDDLPHAANVTCCIRPEALSFADPDPDRSADRPRYDFPPNRLTGRHVQTVYLGESARHTFALTDDLTIEVTEHHPRHRDWSTGPVTLACRDEDVIVLTH